MDVMLMLVATAWAGSPEVVPASGVAIGTADFRFPVPAVRENCRTDPKTLKSAVDYAWPDLYDVAIAGIRAECDANAITDTSDLVDQLTCPLDASPVLVSPRFTAVEGGYRGKEADDPICIVEAAVPDPDDVELCFVEVVCDVVCTGTLTGLLTCPVN